ncbi:MAG: phosphoesterase [Anaerolinea sp.]|nr:phosphoesterase [Anaerolinea sp.]
MIKVEFHCHTEYSADSLVKIDILIAAARKKGLDRVVITDHNEIAGALLARELAPGLVIVGEEVMTTQGELLAFFIERKVPKGLTPEAAIHELRVQGAFISVAHPFDKTRSGSWKLENLQRIAPLVDAIEVFNSRCFSNHANQQALEFAREHSLPGIVGSDAHAAFELGRARLILLDFSNAEELKAALAEARQQVHMSPYWVHFISRWARWTKRRFQA